MEKSVTRKKAGKARNRCLSRAEKELPEEEKNAAGRHSVKTPPGKRETKTRACFLGENLTKGRSRGGESGS